MLAKSLVASLLLQIAAGRPFEAPVSPASLKSESQYLKAEAEKADVNNPIVKAVLGNGFQYFEQDASTTTMTYEADKSPQLVPIIQNLIGATAAVKADVEASIIGAEWVTDGGGVQWNHHSLLYTATDAGSKGSSCNYASFIVRIPKGEPTKRQLFLFHQKTTFSLAPDVIFLRKCTTSSGFLGIGKHTHCKNIPKNIPHSLDEASLIVLQDYLTAVALLALSPDIPPPDSLQSAPLGGLPAVFEATLAALRAEVKKDLKKVQDSNSSTTSKVIKELFSNGFSKWESDMTMQTMQQIAPQGAPIVLKMLTQSSVADQPPAIQKQIEQAFNGILNATEPLVYTSMGCSGNNTCSYLFIMGRTDSTTHKTDLVVIRETAPFTLAPKLIVVRETKHSMFNKTTVTDKVKKVPRNVTQKDLDGILAFFEVSVVNKLSQDSGRIEECALQGLPCATRFAALEDGKVPDMPGKTPSAVPAWQKMVNDMANSSSIMGDISAGAAMGGPVGGVIGGIIGFIPQIAAIFHTSHSHSDTIVGELQGKGFSHISIDQVGPINYNGLPYTSGSNKPVELVMNGIIKNHLSDFGDAATQSDIQTYAMVLANGWQDGSNTWVHQNIVYDSKNGGGTQAVHFLTNADTVKGVANIMFWKTTASIKLADSFIIHRVTDQKSNIFSSKSSCKDELKRVPRSITYDDITALTSFFDIMAAEALATTLNLCGATNISCKYPDISGPKTLVV